MGAGVQIVVTENVSELVRHLREQASEQIAQNYVKSAEIVAGNIRREINTWTSSGGEATGTLARSFKPGFVKRSTGTVRFGVFSSLPYARIHETGGVIRPKNQEYLHFKSRSRGWVKTKKSVIKPKEYLTKAAAASTDAVAELTGQNLRLAISKSRPK